MTTNTRHVQHSSTQPRTRSRRGLTHRFISLSLLFVTAGACDFPDPVIADARPGSGTDSGGGAIDGAPDGSPDASLGPALLGTMSPSAFDFGYANIGPGSNVLVLTIYNTGGSPTSALQLSNSDPTDFVVVPTGDATDCVGLALPAHSLCVVQVHFSPGTASTFSSNLDISATDGGDLEFMFTGTGITISPNLAFVGDSSIDWGNGPPQIMTVTIKNVSAGPLTLTATPDLGSYDDFMVTACSGTRQPNATCTSGGKYGPRGVGMHIGEVASLDSATSGLAVPLKYAVVDNLEIDKTGMGLVASNPPGISCGSSCASQTASFESPVFLVATPDPGWDFHDWSGGCTGTDPTNCFVTGTASVTASFVEQP